ncbi:MAG TPA: sensor histidine kinase [Solirubrobacteraceae bacterium]|nr:sensor histidine kinase [Solirubrobacteraceae bacterium]
MIGFEHQALFHRGEDEFLAGTLPFIAGALEAGEPVLVAVAPRRCELLADALGAEASEVVFADMHRLGSNPARIIPAWRRFLDEHDPDEGPVRGIGEPVWAGRSAPELDECARDERLLNVAFDDGRPWRLMCPYDLAELDAREILAAEASHPFTACAHGARENAGYAPRHDPFAGEVPPPPAATRELRFGAGELGDVRDTVAEWAAGFPLTPERRSDLVLAVNELAANSVMHAGGAGTLALWSRNHTLICEIRDAGQLTVPLAGRVRPDAAQLSGRGLWMANQVCDLVQIRSSKAAGTTVRVHMRLQAGG